MLTKTWKGHEDDTLTIIIHNPPFYEDQMVEFWALSKTRRLCLHPERAHTTTTQQSDPEGAATHLKSEHCSDGGLPLHTSLPRALILREQLLSWAAVLGPHSDPCISDSLHGFF